MKKLGLLITPVLFALGCGGVDCLLTPTDPMCASDANNICGGVTAYQIKTGTGYATSSVKSGPTETCGLGLTAANLVGTKREVRNAGTGIITIYSLGTTTPLELGTGAISCNIGTLTSSGVSFNQNGCDMKLTTTVKVTVTGPSQMDYEVSQTRNQFVQDPTPGAPKCVPPAGGSCAVNYSATMVQ